MFFLRLYARAARRRRAPSFPLPARFPPAYTVSISSFSLASGKKWKTGWRAENPIVRAMKAVKGKKSAARRPARACFLRRTRSSPSERGTVVGAKRAFRKGPFLHFSENARDAEKRKKNLRDRAARAIPIRKLVTSLRASPEPRRHACSASGGGWCTPRRGRECPRANSHTLLLAARATLGDPRRPGTWKRGFANRFSRAAKVRNPRKRTFSAPVPSVAQRGF